MKLILILPFALLLSGCSSSIDGDDYTQQTPKFDLFKFFEGEVKAWGIVQNRNGDVVQRFSVEINGIVKEDTLVLDEKFIYLLGDGPETRVWTIKRRKPGVYTGSANDIPGPATGINYGNAMFFGYEMELPVGDSKYSVRFDDWFFAFDDTTMMNRSYIRKFGITFAEVTIFMQQQRDNIR